MNRNPNPTSLGRQKGALVLEVLKVLGRPASISEVAERVSTVYKLPLQPIQPVVADVLRAGVANGFFECRFGCYSMVPSVVEQLRRDIDEYAVRVLTRKTAQLSPLMKMLQRLDESPLVPGNSNRLVYMHDPNYPQWSSVSDNH
ncbi:uncharacterized protein LOC117583193 [Drosophila guanche]|uniref:DUF4777 domain-containing protein n=1 Tax=Drosophila guanche TaxID=7266 RepID=A0A3B0JJC6_DROGU|nr:uncharacterized protein LOC117583193 [Drosophila guanche]SPP80432.1 Hypothetical predicted protein [Drosophila guanche]